MRVLTVKQAIDFVCDSAPDDPIGYARLCAQEAIKDGELDQAVVWKQVIISLQDERNREVMRPLVESEPDNDGAPVF